MKGNKHGFRRVLAILLSVMLFVSSLGLTVFADEVITMPAGQEENFDEIIFDKDVSASDIEVPADEVEEIVSSQPDESRTEESGDQTINGQDEDEPAGAEDEPAGGEDESAGAEDEPAEAEDEVFAEDTFDEVQPVSVVFNVVPQTAEVTVYPASAEEVFASEAIQTQEDGSFLLFPGDYTYTVRAEGYVSVENAPFAVTGDEQPLLLSFELEAEEEEIPEPEAFDQASTVNGVEVIVRADPGVFPADAMLSVETVPVDQQQQADTAVGEIRDENQNVAVSYIFDIKVIDPETGEEYQPAEGQSVSVSFVLAEAADENLQADVYHVTEDETTGELTAESLDMNIETTAQTGEETTVVVETDGFSIYTVEFTYSDLVYVLPGSTSVPMSEILTTLGLNGEVTEVETSDESLFSASNESGEWIVTAHQAFHTTEWMKVTIHDVVYEINVTDDGAITSWSDLKTALAAGGEVILTQDLTAGADDSTLTIPSGVTVTLDLNGLTLGPGPANDDKVIYVRGGTLILKGDGTITGGNRCRYGIFVESSGTFTMDGGTVTEVTEDGVRVAVGTFTMNGGAIRGSGEYGVNALNSAFTMNGGEITGSKYMGVEIEQSTFTMNGGRISDSYSYDVYFDSNDFYLSGGTVSGEIFLSDNSRIVITSRLDPDDCYNIVMQTNGVFTFGLNGKGDLSNFRSADYPYTVALNGQGEAMLVPVDTVVPYVERSWDGEKVVSKVTSRNNGQWQAFPDDAGITSGWYYLNHDVTKNGRIESITGDVNLILGDGCTLDVKGLYVPPGSTLSIYGQTAGTGRLYSHPSGGAAIGGYSNHDNGNIVICGGTIEANGYDYCAGIGSNDDCTGGSITIYGGDITANGGSDGAGIGGGRYKSGGNITIYGGDITAKGGGNNGAAIGGGKNGDGGSISIYGGTVTTSDSPNENGAGIGGGDSAAGGTITISGGTIKAYSRDGAGIGGGDDGSGGNITISGGEIYSYSVNQGWGARIGGGAKSSSDASPDAGTIVIEGGSITTTGGRGADIGGGYKNTGGGSVTINGGIVNASGSYGIGGGEGGSNVSITMGYTDVTKDTISVTSVKYGGTVTLNDDFAKKDTDIVFEKGTYTDTSQMASVTLTAYVRPEVYYVDLAGEPQSEVCTPVYAGTTAWDNDWYAVTKNVEITSEITVTGDVNLILADGFSLTSKNIKVPAGSSLTVWGQSGGSGTIAAAAGQDTKAGIGGAGSDCGTITINGGTVTATGGEAASEYGYGSAGIGGCLNKKPGTVIINRGTVTATGGKTAAGIGGGGIMPGYDSQISSAGRVEINGGTVTATGKAGGAGIGSGFLCPSDGRSDGVGEILITGGEVNAYGSKAASGGGAGIGGGMKSQAGTITITGGTINAEGTEWSPAIGTGGMDPEELSDDACVGGTITITGGKVTANVPVYGDPDDVDDDANQAAAIGGGCNGGGVTINISGGEVTAASGRIGMGYGYARSDLPCTINLSWTEESKDTMSVTSTSYYSPVNLKKAFKDKTDGTVFPAQDSVWNRLDGRTLIPYESEEQPPVVTIKSANVEFQGEIRLQFTLSFPEGVLADEGACVTFEKAGKTTKVPVSEGIVKEDGLIFVIPVPAPEYADEITVKVYDGEDNQLILKSASGTDYTADGFVYSVKQYARNKAESGSTEEMRALAKALDNYGTAAQICFRYGDYSGLSVDAAVTAVTLNDLVPYMLSTSGTRPAGVTGAGIVVEFDTDNTLRITFKTDGSKALGDYTFLLDNAQTVPARSGNNGYLQVENIAAPNLDIAHTFTVTDGVDTYTVTASALSYAYTSVKNGTEARQDLGKALYLYSQAADAMFGN